MIFCICYALNPSLIQFSCFYKYCLTRALQLRFVLRFITWCLHELYPEILSHITHAETIFIFMNQIVRNNWHKFPESDSRLILFHLRTHRRLVSINMSAVFCTSESNQPLWRWKHRSFFLFLEVWQWNFFAAHRLKWFKKSLVVNKKIGLRIEIERMFFDYYFGSYFVTKCV